jgi:hypothetical protein
VSTPIPAERVPPIAKEIESTRMTWAIVIWFVCGLFMIALAFSPNKPGDPDVTAKIMGSAMLGVPLFLLGLRQFRVSKRATAAGRRAAGKDGTFVLDGRQLLAYDARGIPLPTATIKLSRTQAALLTALPKPEINQ